MEEVLKYYQREQALLEMGRLLKEREEEFREYENHDQLIRDLNEELSHNSFNLRKALMGAAAARLSYQPEV